MTRSSGKPELLAPAGTIEAGLTAFDAGADAVYAGLPKFNARERGQNLTPDELSKLIGFAHSRSRRVYVTLNTLLKEWEVEEVSRVLVDLARLRPDAIIVQDIGLARLVRRHFPELEMHASTQMALHNSAGLEVAKQLGIARVILERQTTLEELQLMKKKTDLELEVFVHGALCCSRSGVCLFSSWMGGWSGNRGRCKQPCRRRYFTKEGNGFFFSPSDLSALDDIPSLVELGVAGLKIEGRLRKPDYVRRVVKAYRMVLDAVADAEVADVKEILSEARATLAGALGRKWHGAFHSTDDFEDVIRHRTLGASGLLCGTVTKASTTGFEVEVSRPLHRYDTIRVQPKSGEEGKALTLSRLVVEKRKVARVGKGQRCWISSTVQVEVGSLVFKTGSVTNDLTERVDELPLARAAVDLDVKLTNSTLRVEAPLVGEIWETSVDLSPAKNRPLTAEALAVQFRKTRSEKLAAGLVATELEADLFVPAGELKKLRRAFWEWAESIITDETLNRQWLQRREAAIEDHGALTITPMPSTVETVIVGQQERAPESSDSITARSIWELDEGRTSKASVDEIVLPDFCSELELPKLREQINGLVGAGHRRFRVTSLFGFALLQQHENLEVSASFPIPACNSSAVEMLRELGANKVMAWVELERAALDALVSRWGGLIEVLILGRLPILTTRFALSTEGRVQDSRGASFTIEHQKHHFNLYPERALAITAPEGASRLIDLTHAKLDETLVSNFNDDRELV